MKSFGIPLFLLLLVCSTGWAGQGPGVEIWLSGVDPFVRQVMQPGAKSDYVDLFTVDAPWGKAAARVAVFKTSTQWILHGPNEALSRMFADLQRRHIALAMEALMIRRNEKCGRGVEGFSDPDTIRTAVERIRKLGGELAYIAMDEPLWFGRRYDGHDACRWDIAKLARNIADNAAAAKQAFPKVHIGDIEPITAAAGADWIDEILRWSAAYQAATGTPLSFFHVDMNWEAQLAGELPQLAAKLRNRGIKFGIIYDGEPTDPTDIDWTRHAEERSDEVEAGEKLIPDEAILQTWMLHPARMMPQDQPGTMTNLVLRYARIRTTLAGLLNGNRFRGRLTEVDGTPVAHVVVALTQTEDGSSGVLVPRTLDGQVPDRAARAVIGLRLDTECGCNGDADIGIGTVLYSESGGAAVARRFAGNDVEGAPSATAGIAEFHAISGRPLLKNSPPFAVSSGRLYRLTVPMRASAGAARSGYVAVIFLDRSGKEVRRAQISFRPGERRLGTAKTNANGGFAYDLDRRTMSRPINATFAGSEQLRAAEAVIKDDRPLPPR